MRFPNNERHELRFRSGFSMWRATAGRSNDVFTVIKAASIPSITITKGLEDDTWRDQQTAT